jgi:hypothetical protein
MEERFSCVPVFGHTVVSGSEGCKTDFFMNIRPCLLALATSLTLAACETPQEPPPAPQPVALQPPPQPVEKPAPPAAKPAHPPAPHRPAKPQAHTPDELVGLDENGVRRFLGAPAEIGTDGPARILSYRAPSCALDVVLFMDVKAGDLRVLSYQWADASAKPAGPKTCYTLLRRAAS